MARCLRLIDRLRAPHRLAGFTLVELLVASAVSGLIVIAAAQILGPHLRSNQRLEAYIRLQERWIRVAYLLDTEAQTAQKLQAAGNTLTLTMPPRSDGSSATIVYTLASAANGTVELRRNGPPITQTGRLDPSGSPSDALLIAGVAANGFTPTVDGTLSLNYGLALIDPNTQITYSNRSTVTRGKADCDSLESDDDDCSLSSL